MSRLVICVFGALSLALLACSDDSSTPSAEAGPDLGADAAPRDAGPQEQPTSPDHAVPRCSASLDLQPLVLDSQLCVAQRFELPAAAAVNLAENDVFVFSLDASAPRGQVQQAQIDPTSGTIGAFSTVFDFTPGLSGTLYAGSYLALSPGGFVAAGYTVDATFEGQIFYGDAGIKAPKLVDQASGNFDAVFLDDQTLLVNGTGVGAAQEGQGVYVVRQGQAPRRLIKDLGVASGYLALGEQVLFAGGYFGSGSRIYGFSLAEVQAAVSSQTTLAPASDGHLILEGSTGDATAVGNDLVVTVLDASWQLEAVKRLPVTVSGDSLSVGTATEVVSLPSGGSSVTVSALTSATGERLGLVLQGESKTELAVVDRK